MNPGRELDALVAEKVMGLIVHRDLSGIGNPVDTFSYPDRYNNEGGTVPPYSTDISSAWEVVKKLESKGFSLRGGDQSDDEQNWCAAFGPYLAFAAVAPHAICLAALKAMGVEVKE